MTVSLILADGTCFKGESFGYEHPVSGELVFNTAAESLCSTPLWPVIRNC